MVYIPHVYHVIFLTLKYKFLSTFKYVPNSKCKYNITRDFI